MCEECEGCEGICCWCCICLDGWVETKPRPAAKQQQQPQLVKQDPPMLPLTMRRKDDADYEVL